MFQQYLPASRWHRVPPRDHQCRRSPSQARTRTSRAKLSVQVAVRSWLAGRSQFSLPLSSIEDCTKEFGARRQTYAPFTNTQAVPAATAPPAAPPTARRVWLVGEATLVGVAGRPRLDCGFNGLHRPLLFDSIYPRVQ